MFVNIWTFVTLIIMAIGIAGNQAKEKRLVVETDIEQALVDLRAELTAFKTSTNAILAKLQSKDTFSTFVRWGKNDCAMASELIYRGYIAGKKYNDPGSSSTSLCLPSDPTWANYTDSHEPFRSTLYGTEIDHVDPGHVIFGKDVLQEDMPCAVCKTQYSATMMFPARSTCYPGWTMQYIGYLVSNIAGADRGSYDMICLDGDPDFVPHGVSNDDQHVIYVAEAHCGSLPCPPYVENRELACSVCSK